jgi:hypothetical protein
LATTKPGYQPNKQEATKQHPQRLAEDERAGKQKEQLAHRQEKTPPDTRGGFSKHDSDILYVLKRSIVAKLRSVPESISA